MPNKTDKPNAPTAATPALKELLERITSKDDTLRTEAWQGAGAIGAPAVKPLAGLLTSPEMETARAAKRGLWKIIHTVGAPGGDTQKQAVIPELHQLLKGTDTPTRREVLWMLSEIGGDESVQPIAALLADKEVREDARGTLQRIPGEKSLAALKEALRTAPEEFKPALAEALRDRGVKIEGYPSRKLVPTKETTVKPEA